MINECFSGLSWSSSTHQVWSPCVRTRREAVSYIRGGEKSGEEL